MDLEALENEFAANSWPKTAEKTELLQKLKLVKTVLLLSIDVSRSHTVLFSFHVQQ